MMLEIHRAKTLNSGNPQSKFILHWGIFTRPCSHHFQALPSSTTMPHSTWHQARSQALVPPKDIRVMGHCVKYMISPKEVMVDLKYSPLSNSQDMGCHLQAHLKCLQHGLKTIRSFGRHCPPLLHQDNFSAHLGDPLLASHRNDFTRLQNRRGQMLQGLRIWPHYQRFPMVNMMQIMRATIRQTWVGLKVKHQSAWSKQISPRSNFPKEWGNLTFVPSTSGRKYGWLGFWRRSIGP